MKNFATILAIMLGMFTFSFAQNSVEFKINRGTAIGDFSDQQSASNVTNFGIGYKYRFENGFTAGGALGVRGYIYDEFDALRNFSLTATGSYGPAVDFNIGGNVGYTYVFNQWHFYGGVDLGLYSFIGPDLKAEYYDFQVQNDVTVESTAGTGASLYFMPSLKAQRLLGEKFSLFAGFSVFTGGSPEYTQDLSVSVANGGSESSSITAEFTPRSLNFDFGLAIHF